MKKRVFFCADLRVLFLSCNFYSCGNHSGNAIPRRHKQVSREDKVKALEDKILELQQDKYLSEADSKEKIKSASKSARDQLKNSVYGSSSTTSVTTESMDFLHAKGRRR
jgi:hypothetical protein